MPSLRASSKSPAQSALGTTVVDSASKRHGTLVAEFLPWRDLRGRAEAEA